MSTNWYIIGISGVTCGGKTTLATELNKLFPDSRIISQDDYFLDVDDMRHTWVPELNHIHFDILTSLDMDEMHKDIEELLSNSNKVKTNGLSKKIPAMTIPLREYNKVELQKMIDLELKQMNANLLIIEGFCIFSYRPIEYLCNSKYFFKLDREECFAKRNRRVYEPPDCPGYFEICVWPEYLKQLKDIEENVNDVKYFDENTRDPMLEVLLDMSKVL